MKGATLMHDSLISNLSSLLAEKKRAMARRN